MRRLVLSLLGAVALAGPASAATAPAPATAPSAPAAAVTGKSAAVKKNPHHLASAGKSAHRHQRHAAAAKPAVPPSAK